MFIVKLRFLKEIVVFYRPRLDLSVLIYEFQIESLFENYNIVLLFKCNHENWYFLSVIREKLITNKIITLTIIHKNE